jgi:hypothetical protein
MHNPFGRLTTRLLCSLLAGGNRYFVRQTFLRGLNPLDPMQKAAFLFTHYSSYGEAKAHYDHLTGDPNRFLYDSADARHLARLETAARQQPEYPVYLPLLNKPWQPSARIAEQIRRYINHHLHWTPARRTAVEADLVNEFGELFVNLKYRERTAKVPLADIEQAGAPASQ